MPSLDRAIPHPEYFIEAEEETIILTESIPIVSYDEPSEIPHDSAEVFFAESSPIRAEQKPIEQDTQAVEVEEVMRISPRNENIPVSPGEIVMSETSEEPEPLHEVEKTTYENDVVFIVPQALREETIQIKQPSVVTESVDSKLAFDHEQTMLEEPEVLPLVPTKSKQVVHNLSADSKTIDVSLEATPKVPFVEDQPIQPLTTEAPAKPMQEVVTNVLAILHTDKEEETAMSNHEMIIANDEGIGIIYTENKVILGVSEILHTGSSEKPHERPFAPVKTFTELGKAFDTMGLILTTLAHEETKQTDKHDPENEKKSPELVMVVSPGIVTLLEMMRSQNDSGEKEGIANEDTKRTITFVVEGEPPQTLSIDAKEFVRLQALLGTAEESVSQPENAPISTLMKLSERLFSLEATTKDAEAVQPHDEKQIPRDETLLVSEGILTFLENMREKSPLPVRAVGKSEVKGEETPVKRTITFITEGEGGRSIVITEEELHQLQSFFIEHELVMSNGPSEQEKHGTSRDEQVSDELEALLTGLETQPTENNTESRLNVSKELLEVIQEENVRIQKKELPEVTAKTQLKAKMRLTITSGKQEIVIDYETLRRIKELLNAKKHLIVKPYVVDEEAAPEEIKGKITPYQAGSDRSLLLVYQMLYYLLEGPTKQSFDLFSGMSLTDLASQERTNSIQPLRRGMTSFS